MILLVSALVIIILILCIYIIFLNKQIKNINMQIDRRINEKSRQAITLQLFNKNLNMLSKNFNKILRVEEKLRIETMQHEENFKEMIADISHDLRTPLTAIKGYMQVLDKSMLEKKQKDNVRIALNHINDLEKLINNFFELSYLEISKSEVKFTKINLTNSVLNNIMDYVQQFEEKNIRVEFGKEEPVYVLGNEEKINRIIQNLIKNALNYSSGDVVIDIFFKDERVILSFKNPVFDINQIKVDSLFDKFYVAEKSRGKSTGLGLSIVKMLTEQMKGKANAFLKENNIDIQIELNRYINE